MAFSVSAALLDSLVLSIVSKGDTYGYKITQEIREAIEMSESTLYPVLRRLLKNGLLESYDREFMGRNRRYYKTTEKGDVRLSAYKSEWESYKGKIENILLKEDAGGETGVVRNNTVERDDENDKARILEGA
jgi:PadR family transcriptional regulator PadR